MSKRDYDRARYVRLKAERAAARPPDPILGLTDIERAYLAGLVDGEGSIYVGAIGGQRGRTCYPIFAIGMTDKEVIEWMGSGPEIRIGKTNTLSAYRANEHSCCASCCCRFLRLSGAKPSLFVSSLVTQELRRALRSLNPKSTLNATGCET